MKALRIQSISPNGDCGLIVSFFPDEDTLKGIHALAEEWLRSPMPHMINVIPATETLVLVFDRPIQYEETWLSRLRDIIIQPRTWHREATIHEVPVCYEPSLAADLDVVLDTLSLSQEDLIERHSKPLYEVMQLGFLPGFVYLDGNLPDLEVPRKSTPVLQVPKGSVAVANRMTGIYSLATPGGWHVIGRTPCTLLNLASFSPQQIRPLDQVRFVPISLDDFFAMEQTGCN
ncbi:allophanate hydrolase subunit 1 [Marinicella sediminis]|uniref:Allophanate hydrolase subunit 1 n=1 Tax=Marinicella sediminis TaxID=1792834 RepID=A0ABV7JFV6_9GAMM|nr:allophanate hydrolase subunit 1 [Marinicella sediminis]